MMMILRTRCTHTYQFIFLGLVVFNGRTNERTNDFINLFSIIALAGPLLLTTITMHLIRFYSSKPAYVHAKRGVSDTGIGLEFFF